MSVGWVRCVRVVLLTFSYRKLSEEAAHGGRPDGKLCRYGRRFLTTRLTVVLFLGLVFCGSSCTSCMYNSCHLHPPTRPYGNGVSAGKAAKLNIGTIRISSCVHLGNSRMSAANAFKVSMTVA